MHTDHHTSRMIAQEHLVDVFQALDDVRERRLLLQLCPTRVVVRAEAVEVHVPANPVIFSPGQALEPLGKWQHTRRPDDADPGDPRP
jgi:hypothetical protein